MLTAIWNSVARRRRSISDTFFDNGLAALKGHLEERGHEVRIIDWATDAFFAELSPARSSRVLRSLYAVLLRSNGRVRKSVLGFLSMILQKRLGAIQTARLNVRLRRLARGLKAQGVKVFGIKVWYGEAFANALRLARMIRAVAPEILIVAGGYHVTLYEGRVLEAGDFDLGVVREGEEAFDLILSKAEARRDAWDKTEVLRDIVEAAERGEIGNLVYRMNGGIRLSERSEPDGGRRCLPRYDDDADKVRIHVLTESVGCAWGRCHFCVHRHFSARFAARGIDGIVGEIEAMVRKGIGVFRFAGSDTPPAFGARIARSLLAKSIGIVFAMGSRPVRGAAARFEGLVADYATLIEGGLRAVFMGGETGNDAVNDAVMNKGLGFEDIAASVAALREAERRAGHRVFLSLALIYPTPLLGMATLDDVARDNLRLLRETRPDSVMITPPGPFLHTAWYEERERFGFEVDEAAVRDAMSYEYVLYKPPRFWPKLGIALEGRPFQALLEECGSFRGLVQKELGIPTDCSDEHFLMFYAAGIRDAAAILAAKNETMLDILSCDYTWTRRLSAKVNEYSRELSRANVR